MLYKLVSADLRRLTKLVKGLLHQGWILYGGIAFDDDHYLQEMKEADKISDKTNM